MAAGGRQVVVVVGGPNGAGKSTTARAMLPKVLNIQHFVNADVIAAGLSAFAPESVAPAAGRIMLLRLRELAQRGESFAFESTLASRSFAPFRGALRDWGYQVILVYLYLSSPELAVARVRQRVADGGHSIPEQVVRRRFSRSWANLQELYRPLADLYLVCDNSTACLQQLAATQASEVSTGLSLQLMEAMRQAVSTRIEEQLRSGAPAAIWQDEGVTWLSPTNIPGARCSMGTDHP